MSEKILRAKIEFVREGVGVPGLDVGGASGRIIGAGYGEKRLASVDDLPGGDQYFVDRTANGRKHRSGLKGVVSHGARQTQSPGKRRFLRGHYFDMSQLFLGHSEQLCGIRACFGGSE